MPAKPMWLLRVPVIIDELRSMDVPVVDRAMCERVFGVRRRSAIDLMQRVGGYQCGRTYIVKRQDLLDWLKRAQDECGFHEEQRRKQKLTTQLDELHRHRAAARVKIAVIPGYERSKFPEMPNGITLGPGAMSVSFSNVEELLARLYIFSQTIAHDLETFSAMVQDLTAGGEATPVAIPAKHADEFRSAEKKAIT